MSFPDMIAVHERVEKLGWESQIILGFEHLWHTEGHPYCVSLEPLLNLPDCFGRSVHHAVRLALAPRPRKQKDIQEALPLWNLRESSATRKTGSR